MRVKGDQLLTTLLIRQRCDDSCGTTKNLIYHFFDPHMRDHFTADFAEPTHSIRDSYEPILVDCRYITGYVPFIPEDLRRELRLVEIAEHAIGAFNEKQTFLPAG